MPQGICGSRPAGGGAATSAGADGRRAGVEGERGREQVGGGEPRAALREMGERPVHRRARGIGPLGMFERVRLARRDERTALAWFGGARLLRPRRSNAEATSPFASKPSAAAGLAQVSRSASRSTSRLAARALSAARRARCGFLPCRAPPRILHCRLDLRAPRGEGVDDLARDAGDLEPPVSVGLPCGTAEPPEFAGPRIAVERSQRPLRGVEPLVGHGAPAPAFALHHVGDHRVRVQCGIEVPGRIVAERGDHRLRTPGPSHAPARRVLHPGLGGVPLEPGFRGERYRRRLPMTHMSCLYVIRACPENP